MAPDGNPCHRAPDSGHLPLRRGSAPLTALAGRRKLTIRRLAAGGLVAILFLAVAFPAAAADENSRYKLRGHGAFQCSKYLADRRADLKATSSYADWFNGYLTAYNLLQPQTYAIAPNHDAGGLLTYLDLFCAKNPNTLVGVAVREFTKAVYDKRQVSGK